MYASCRDSRTLTGRRGAAETTVQAGRGSWLLHLACIRGFLHPKIKGRRVRSAGKIDAFRVDNTASLDFATEDQQFRLGSRDLLTSGVVLAGGDAIVHITDHLDICPSVQ